MHSQPGVPRPKDGAVGCELLHTQWVGFPLIASSLFPASFCGADSHLMIGPSGTGARVLGMVYSDSLPWVPRVLVSYHLLASSFYRKCKCLVCFSVCLLKAPS